MAMKPTESSSLFVDETFLVTRTNVWSKVVVFLGSTREIRLGERVAKFVIRKLQERRLDVEFVDPLEFRLPLLTKPIHFYLPPDKPPQRLVDMNEKIKTADAVIVISAEYNHSIPPGLTNTMDYFSPEAYAKKPSGIVTYSPSLVGGARAGVQLRSFLAAIGCISVSMTFNISNAHLALTEEGEPSHTEEGLHLDSSCNKLLKQLEWWANAAKSQRKSSASLSASSR